LWWTPRKGWKRRPSPTSYQAINANHEIRSGPDKVDLPAAEPERVRSQIEDVIGIDASNARADLRQDRIASKKYWKPSSPACRRR